MRIRARRAGGRRGDGPTGPASRVPGTLRR